MGRSTYKRKERLIGCRNPGKLLVSAIDGVEVSALQSAV